MKRAIVFMFFVSTAIAARIDAPPPYEGVLYWDGERIEFRRCGLDERHLVDASFSILDTVDQYRQTHRANASNSLYVRFNGKFITNTAESSNPGAVVVRITDLLSFDIAVPASCT